MKPWKRLGGTRHLHPALRHRRPVGHVCRRGAGRAARSTSSGIMYEKVVLGRRRPRLHRSLEGRPGKKQTFEWQKGSLFTIPLNAIHRFVNATSSPALLLCGTTAPNMMNLVDNPNFIFNCPYQLHRPLSRATTITSSRTRTSSPIRCAASRCGAPTSFPTSSIANCRSTTAVRPAIAASSRTWPATASTSGSASTRPAAIPRRTSTRRRRC